MDAFREHLAALNETNGTYHPERNLSSPLERTLITESEGPENRPMPPVDLEAMRLQNRLIFMQTYMSPWIFCTGIPLNLLSLAIVTRGGLRRTSLIQYICAILTTDVTLLANLFMMWLTQRGFDLYRLGALCHFTSFLSHTSSFLSLWITVGLAVDGYIRICFPASTKSFCTTIRARVVILCLVACATAVYLNISLMVGVIRTMAGHICAPVNRYVHTLKVLGKTDIFINVMLPYFGLIYLLVHTAVVAIVENCKAAWSRRRTVHLRSKGEERTPGHTDGKQKTTSLNQARNDHRDPGNQSQNQPHLLNKNEVARICLCFVFFTLCLNLPSAVFRTFLTLLQMRYPEQPMVVTQFLWQQLLQYPYYLKSACNFFTLLLASGDFRRTVFRCCFYSTVTVCTKAGITSGNGRERVSIEADPEDPEM